MINRDTSPNDLLLGGCDNASRVVSYVVVMGQGYASNPLLDMRIHDINVEADPNKHAPAGPDPVKADGTSQPKPESERRIEEYGIQGAAEIEPSWSGPWPLCHLVCSYVQSIFSITFHITVDLLSQVNVQTFYLGVADDPSVPGSAVAAAVLGAVLLIFELASQEEQQFWSTTMIITWGACKLISLAKIASPWLEALFYILLATWWYAFCMSLAFAVDHIVSGDYSPLTSALALVGLFAFYLMGGTHSWLSQGSAAAIHGALDWPKGYAECFKTRTNLFMAIAQFAALIVIIIVAAGLFFGAFG